MYCTAVERPATLQKGMVSPIPTAGAISRHLPPKITRRSRPPFFAIPTNHSDDEDAPRTRRRAAGRRDVGGTAQAFDIDRSWDLVIVVVDFPSRLACFI